MSGLAMWLRSNPLLRNLLIGGVVAGLVVLVAVLVQPAGHSSPAPTAAPSAQTAAEQSASNAPTAPPTSNPATATAQAEDAAASVADAKAIARQFLEAYASYRYDDTLDIQRQRVRAFVTARFDADYAKSSGATAGQQVLAQHHEIATATVQQLESDSNTTTQKVYLDGLVAVHVANDQGSQQNTVSVVVTLVHEAAGWRVDEVSL